MSRSQSQLARQWSRAQAVLKKYRRNLMRRKGVLGAEVSYRIRKNAQGIPTVTSEVCIAISVEHKGQCNSRSEITGPLDGVPVDIIHSRGVQSQGGIPVIPGMAISAIATPGTFGTMGMPVTNAGNQTRLLTCHHVLPNPGTNVIATHIAGTPIIGSVGPRIPNQYGATVDCALIVPHAGLNIIGPIPGIPGPYFIRNGLTEDDKQKRTRVVKCGAATGVTGGRVQQIDATVDLIKGGVVRRMIGQITIMGDGGPDTFNSGGDSGAVVVRAEGPDRGEIVGLLHGILKDDAHPNLSSGMGVACHMLDVAEILGITV